MFGLNEPVLLCYVCKHIYIHYSLLTLCAVVKYKMYEPPSLLQFGIHSYSTVGVQEFESSKKVFIIRHFKSQGGLCSNRRNLCLVFFFFAVYSLWIAHALWKFVESAHFVHLFEVETNQFPCTWLEIELKKKWRHLYCWLFIYWNKMAPQLNKLLTVKFHRLAVVSNLNTHSPYPNIVFEFQVRHFK